MNPTGQPTMKDLIGQTLGHYRVVELIGEGGMGEVYRARDERLDRDVAIKVLPEAVANDPERLARFEREAKLLAALSHQNIATLYGLEEHGGGRYLVMELVEGETLADRIARGPLPVDDALTIAVQIANGLEAAHERGIVHRDLKPANVMASPEDKVKILDFGLAKAWLDQPSDADLTHSPTLTARMTSAGVLLGTAAYMSPEQACGKPVDKRTDIWAFGCVLFEMLTGRRAFAGESLSETTAAILKEEPDWSPLPGGTPAAVRTVLGRCLAKDRERRLHDIADARIAIEDLATEDLPPAGIPARRSWRLALPWLVAAVAAVCAVVAVWTGRREASSSRRGATRLVVSVPHDQRLVIGSDAALALSPDGSQIVYSASSPPGSRSRLWLRRLDEFDASPIPGTEGAVGPFFSPDGQWLGYFAQGALAKVFVNGGTPIQVCDVTQVVPGATWGSDGTIIFTNRPNFGLSRVSADGGTPEPLTTLDFAGGETAHGWPQILPDGTGVLFTILEREGTEIAVLSLADGKVRRLARGLGAARYLPTGQLVFAQAEGLAAAGFDPKKLELTSSPVIVLDDVYSIPAALGLGLAAFSVSDKGTLAYLPGGVEAGRNRLVWVDRDGRTRLATRDVGAYEWPKISPDGTRIAAANRTKTGATSTWILDIQRDSRSRLTPEGDSILPVWTPDGRQIVFGSVAIDSGVVNIYRRSADGSGEIDRLLDGKNPRFPGSWSPDGLRLALTEWNPDTMRDIWILTLNGEHKAVPIISTPYDEHSPFFSPDGRWLAYVSDESGRPEIYVQSYPTGSGRWLVSTSGGTEPVWSADGTELFYRSGDAMMAVPVRTKGGFAAGAPSMLFDKPLKRGIYDSPSYDVTADGERFLMIERDLESAPAQVNVVLHWDQELQRTVPVNHG
jgi:Tol biopolymer transport system component